MNLDLFQILERLSHNYTVLPYSNKYSPCIRKVRLWDDSVQPDRETLYLSETVPEISSDSFSLLLLSADPPKELPDQIISFAVVSGNISKPLLLTEIQETLDWYQQWEQNILHSLLQDPSLQTILDLCALPLRNPVGLVDMNRNLILKSGTIPSSSSKGALWDYFLSYGISPEEPSVEREMSLRLKTEHEPFYFTSDNEFQKINRLIAPLWHDHTFLGVLGLSDVTEEFTPGEYANVCQIQKFMELAISHTNIFRFVTPNIPWFIAQLLRGQTVSSDVLNFNMQKYHWKEDTGYRVWTFRNTSQNREDLEARIANFSYLFDTELVFSYAGQIIVLDTKEREKIFQDKVDSITRQIFLEYGCSMVFSSLTELHTAFLQCQTALSTLVEGREAVGCRFEEIYPFFLDRLLSESGYARAFCFPGFSRLQTIKSEYRNDLISCLDVYIRTGCNLTRTAELLHIHRHTAIYRIEKIESLLGRKISELDWKELRLLWLSCNIEQF